MVKLDEDLIILNEKGEVIPVYIEGEAPDDLPDEYYTVSEDNTGNAVSADNKPQEYLYEFTLKWYTKYRERLYSGLQDAITQLRGKGYDIEGNGYKNPTYQNTWVSRAVDVEKLENLEV